MSDLFWLTQSQMRRIEPYFPLSHGVPRRLGQQKHQSMYPATQEP